MPVLPASAIPSLLRSLPLPPTVPSSARALLPLFVSTTLGHSQTWLKPTLQLALDALPPTPSPVPPQPPLPLLDEKQHPRRFLVAQLKEALVKSSILIGVPKAIETLLEMKHVVSPEDWSSNFVRQELDKPGSSLEARQDAGRQGLRSVYQHQLDPIFTLMHDSGLDDLRFLSEAVTYGTYLTPFPPSPSAPSSHPAPPHSPDPFAHTPHLLPILTLSCLIPQRTPREILWHLRGALRLGWSREDVEVIQGAVERVCEACGVEGVGEGMPRVVEVERVPEEGEK